MLSIEELFSQSLNSYSIVNEAAHDALGDITATGKVLGRFLSDMKTSTL